MNLDFALIEENSGLWVFQLRVDGGYLSSRADSPKPATRNIRRKTFTDLLC